MSKKQPKLTGWFSGDKKPARVGYYQRKWGGFLTDHPDYWDGSAWFIADDSGFIDAEPSLNQLRPWRGLAVKP